MLHAFYRRATGVDLFASNTQLETVTLLLYRSVLKQLHRHYTRPGALQARLEEFGWLFHRAAAERNLGRKEAHLQVLAEVEAALRAGNCPPLPTAHFSTTNTYTGFHSEENSLTRFRDDRIHSRRL